MILKCIQYCICTDCASFCCILCCFVSLYELLVLIYFSIDSPCFLFARPIHYGLLCHTMFICPHSFSVFSFFFVLKFCSFHYTFSNKSEMMKCKQCRSVHASLYCFPVILFFLLSYSFLFVGNSKD